MPPAEIVRIRNPQALDIPPFRDLFARAWAAASALGAPFDDLVPQLREAIQDPNHLIYMALESGNPCGLVCCDTTPNPLAYTPFIYAAYNSGKRATLRRLLRTLFAQLRENGHSHAYGLNAQMRDSALARMYQAVATGRRVASVMRFEFK